MLVEAAPSRAAGGGDLTPASATPASDEQAAEAPALPAGVFAFDGAPAVPGDHASIGAQRIPERFQDSWIDVPRIAMHDVPPFAHREVPGRPDVQSVHGEHQEHFGSPATDTPQFRQFRDDGGVIGVRQRLIEVENPGTDGVGYSFDGLGLRT